MCRVCRVCRAVELWFCYVLVTLSTACLIYYFLDGCGQGRVNEQSVEEIAPFSIVGLPVSETVVAAKDD